MRSIVNTVTLSLIGAFIAGPAFAGSLVVLPEPGMIGLFAAGAVAVILLKNRNRK
ncbi:MAG: PEP-CTERM sorting domain-containing protein [Rhodospirillales bacterium]|nr:PEP-CTERM sorting domain-containing protein [Rhodospirillales bacterium]